MPLSKDQNRERMRRARAQGTSLLAKRNVRAMRRAGIDPEAVDWDEGGPGVSQPVYYALMRDRDAIKAHLGWHHESVTVPDIGTRLERVEATNAALGADNVTLRERILRLEADQVVREASGEYAT